MKFFVVEIIYTRPFDEVAVVVDEHRAYLQPDIGTDCFSSPDRMNRESAEFW